MYSISNDIIIDSLAVEEDLIKVVSQHLSTAGGKRMRPILTVLCSRMFGYTGDQSIKLAAAVEFIHMATLLHDDVEPLQRRRRWPRQAHGSLHHTPQRAASGSR